VKRSNPAFCNEIVLPLLELVDEKSGLPKAHEQMIRKLAAWKQEEPLGEFLATPKLWRHIGGICEIIAEDR